MMSSELLLVFKETGKRSTNNEIFCDAFETIPPTSGQSVAYSAVDL